MEVGFTYKCLAQYVSICTVIPLEDILVIQLVQQGICVDCTHFVAADIGGSDIVSQCNAVF